MVLYLLAKVYNGHNGCVLRYNFRNGLIDSFEVFCLCTGSLAICDRFWGKRPKCGEQFCSVSRGKALWGQIFSKKNYGRNG